MKRNISHTQNSPGVVVRVVSCLDNRKWKSMLYSHLDMTEKEAGLRLKGDWAADIRMFDCIEKEALKMAECMFFDILNRN